MLEVSENDLYKYFKDKRFSELSFLYDEAPKSKNLIHLGILYFLMDAKNEDKSHILDIIEKLKGDKASAYLHLAQIAEKIYVCSGPIVESYQKEAFKNDPQNADAVYAMYSVTHDHNYLILALRLLHEQNKPCGIYNLINQLNDRCLEQIQNLNLEDLELIENCYSELKKDSDLSNVSMDALIFVYLIKGEHQKGLELLKESKFVDAYVLKQYMDKGFLSENEALIKVHQYACFQITNDPKKIFEVNKKCFERGEDNPILTTMLKVAFDAKEYDYIVDIYTHPDHQNNYSIKDSDSIAYYLLANFFLNGAIDQAHYEMLLKSNDRIANEALKDLVKCYKLIVDLDKIAEKTYQDRFFGIGNSGVLSDLNQLLSKSRVINEDLYEDLLKRKKAIFDKNQENETIGFLEDDVCSGLDFDNPIIRTLYDCQALFIKKEYRKLIDALHVFHKNNSPSVLSYKYMADSYHQLGDKINMCEYYRLAYKLGEITNDYSQQIALNYMMALEQVYPNRIDEIEKLKNKFNLDLASQFRLRHIKSKPYYKYCPFNINTIDALTNQYFYLPNKKQLNDPIELPKLEYPNLKYDLIDDYRVFSLSENSDSMLMWSHYAENHKGICITYTLGNFMPYGVGVQNVTYSNSAKRLVDRNDAKYRYQQHLLTKNEDWSYEKEVRIFTIHEKLYYEKFDYLDYDRNKVDAYVHSITLGCDFPEAKESLIKKLIQSINNSNPQNPDIRLIRAKIPTDNPFSLAYEDITHELTTGI